jgi:hypothetical protein
MNTRRVPLLLRSLPVSGAIGVLGGISYVALRRRWPRVGRWGGLAFGATFFAIADELMMPLLRLTPGPRRFSWKVHARRAIAHVLYGVAAEMAARVLEKGSASGSPLEASAVSVETARSLGTALRSPPTTIAGLPDTGRLA